MAKDKPQPDGSAPEKPTLLQTVAAAIAGVLVVKLAVYIVTTLWRLVTKEDPPQMDQPVSPAKKAAWLALIGAVSGMSRQTVRT